MADAPKRPLIFRQQTQREDEIAQKVIRLQAEIERYRVTFSEQWEEVSELILPNLRNTFYRSSYNFPGMKKTQKQVDATGMMALGRFAAILDSLLTPRNMTWHALEADNPYVQKDRQSRLWFEKASRALFKARYSPSANFSSQNLMNYTSLGAFGNMGMFIDRLMGPKGEPLKGLRYKAIPLGELFVRENHQGQIDSFVRAFRRTARQAIQKWGDSCPEAIWAAAQQQSEQLFDFFHCVIPNDDFDPISLRGDKMKFASHYVCLQSKTVLYENGRDTHGGYNSFPLPFSRYEQAPGEVYGRGPAMNILPALKTLNAEKTTFLKVGHRAADPVLLTSDDGIVDFSLRPGALNKGGVNADGKPLVQALQPGNVQITLEMMQEEKGLVNDAFLVTLFAVLQENPNMTATQVVELINQKGILLAPTLGRQQSDYLGPTIDRELDLMADMGMLEPMPGLLKEARGEYHVVYTSPLSRAQRAQEAAGFMRWLETINSAAQVTQDPSLYDRVNFDVALPAVAEIQSVPESWTRGDKEVDAIRQARAKQQQAQQEIQAAPAAAAMMKARAVAQEKGGGQPAQPAAQ